MRPVARRPPAGGIFAGPMCNHLPVVKAHMMVGLCKGWQARGRVRGFTPRVRLEVCRRRPPLRQSVGAALSSSPHSSGSNDPPVAILQTRNPRRPRARPRPNAAPRPLETAAAPPPCSPCTWRAAVGRARQQQPACRARCCSVCGAHMRCPTRCAAASAACRPGCGRLRQTTSNPLFILPDGFVAACSPTRSLPQSPHTSPEAYSYTPPGRNHLYVPGA